MYTISQVSLTKHGLRAPGGETKSVSSLFALEPVEWLRERGENGWEEEVTSLKGFCQILCGCLPMFTGTP